MESSEENDEFSDQDNQQKKVHECLICFHVFANAYRLKRHSIVHSTDNKVFNCQFCELTFRLHKELITHEATHKRTLANINLKRCKICGVVCHNDNILDHLKEFHEHFECDLCQKVYGTKNHLKLHMRTHINAREYKCSQCPKSFNFFSQVKRHERCHSTTYVLYCEICGAGAKSKPSLVRHMQSHSGEKPFQCDRCDRCFTGKQSLRMHIRIHDGEKPYVCPWVECGRAFHDLATMKVHTRLHTNENPYICHLCGKTTKQASNLKSHYLHAHKIKDMTSKTIRANARLFQKHKTENLPEAGFLEILSQQVAENLARQQAENTPTVKQEKGVTNDKLSPDQLEFEQSMIEPLSLVVVTEEDSSNVISDELSVTNNNVIYAMSPHTAAIKNEMSSDVEVNNGQENELRIKDELFVSTLETIQPVVSAVTPTEKMKNVEEVQKSHRKRQTVRQKPKQQPGNATKRRKTELVTTVTIVNDKCVDEFEITELNDNGREAVDKTQSESANNESLSKLIDPHPTTKKTEKQFKCDTCPRSYTQKSKLKVHMKKHTDDEATQRDKLKICDRCGKTFNENSALLKHQMFTHSKLRPFSCEVCGRAFKDSSGLKIHMRSHTLEKPYNCSFCPKSFSTSMGKTLHERCHTGFKPFKCTYCDSAFSDQSTLKQHIRVHTGEKPYICDICGKGTTQAGNLKSHLRHAHKIHVKHVSMKRDNIQEVQE